MCVCLISIQFALCNIHRYTYRYLLSFIIFYYLLVKITFIFLILLLMDHITRHRTEGPGIFCKKKKKFKLLYFESPKHLKGKIRYTLPTSTSIFWYNFKDKYVFIVRDTNKMVMESIVSFIKTKLTLFVHCYLVSRFI